MLFALMVASFAYFKIFGIPSHHENLICVEGVQHNQICKLTNFARAKKMAMKTFYVYVILIICYTPSLFNFLLLQCQNLPLLY